MNDYVLSIVLGIVEGLTEFLPVSSTAHLRLFEALATRIGLTHISLEDPYWKMYTVVIQLGAVLCLPVYFWGRITKFLSTFPRGERGDRTVFTHPLTLTLLAFFVTALPAWAMSKIIGKHLESLYIMGGALLVGGIVMWVVDALFRSPTTLHMEEMSPLQAAWVGAVQILSAVFPGTSRSMATIAAGQTAGLSRSAALEFSFFVSMPTMLAATLYDLKKSVLSHSSGNLAPVEMTGHGWIVLGIGFVVSFIVALAVVAWFMHWVRRRGFVPFAIYRIILGLVVLAWATRAHP